MKILIFGAGAIGSFFGGLLSKKYDVTLLGRKKHVMEINKNGLKIIGKTDDVVYPKAVHDLKMAGKMDLIMLTVKSYDTKDAVIELSKKGYRDTLILSLQNGLGNLEIMRNYMGDVLRGVTSHGVMFTKPGYVYHSGVGETVIGEIDGRFTERIKRMGEMFNSVGIETRISGNILRDLWVKTIVNASINPITAVTGLKNGQLLEIPILKKFMEDVCMESVNVANKLGINFSKNLLEEVRKIAALTAENKSSMLQDVEKGKKTEIDAINNTIIRIGKKYGVATPINKTLVALVKGLEKTRVTHSMN